MRVLILSAALLLFAASVMAVSDDNLVPIDKMPEMTGMAHPAYPEQAKNDGLSCMVMVKAYIDKDGNVSEAEIIECDNPGQGFEQAALDAAYKGTYKPAEQKGKPVGVWVQYKVLFELDGK